MTKGRGALPERVVAEQRGAQWRDLRFSGPPEKVNAPFPVGNGAFGLLPQNRLGRGRLAFAAKPGSASWLRLDDMLHVATRTAGRRSERRQRRQFPARDDHADVIRIQGLAIE